MRNGAASDWPVQKQLRNSRSDIAAAIVMCGSYLGLLELNTLSTTCKDLL